MFNEKPIVVKEEITALTEEELQNIKDFYYDFVHEDESILALKCAVIHEYPALKRRLQTSVLRKIVQEMDKKREETKQDMIALVKEKEYLTTTAIENDLEEEKKIYAIKVINKYIDLEKFKELYIEKEILPINPIDIKVIK